MTDIDWSKAPKGYPVWLEFKIAGHCSYSGWYRKDGEYFKGYFGAHWPSCREGQFFDVFREEKKSLILDGYLPPLKTTQPAAWNGPQDGLPPVGFECLDRDGDKAVIVAHHMNGKFAIFAESLDKGVLYYGRPGDFRPIRTPEQIAADEREAAVAAMLAVLGVSDSRDTYLIQRLYDAGYRKQEQAQ